MRLVVEKWVLTRTLNQQANVESHQVDSNNNNNDVTSSIRNDLVIEQTLHQEQMLYQKLNDSVSDQSDHSISMANLDDIDNGNKISNVDSLPQVSTLYMNITNNDNTQTNKTNQNEPINLVFNNNDIPYKRNEVIVYLDAFDSSSESKINEKSNSNNISPILINTQSLMTSNQLEKGCVKNNNNHATTTNLQDSMSTTLLLNVSKIFLSYLSYYIFQSLSLSFPLFLIFFLCYCFLKNIHENIIN
jgi:hypothetical protein